MNAESPIANWLKASRLAQKMIDADGEERPWTIKHLLELMDKEIGWAPASSNYSNYENGKANPRPATLRRFVRFWSGRGQPGPDLSPKAEPVSSDQPSEQAQLIAAIGDLVRQVEAERAERRRWEVGWITTLRAALVGQVPTELLDALVPPPPGESLR